MKILARLTAIALAMLPTLALAQTAVLQGGPFTAGHAQMYVGSGSSQPIVQDSGPAGGGGTGLGFGEMLLTARGTGTPPYVGQGTGPFGSNWCDYDAPTTSSGGYHYLCLSPNATGGFGLLSFGAGGVAPPLDFKFNINGILFSLGDITTPNVAIKLPASLATTSNIVLSGEQVIDGQMTSLSRVLVDAQSTAAQNGCYYSGPSTWTRCSDWTSAGQVVQGTIIYVTGGNVNGGSTFVVVTAGSIIPGVTPVSFISEPYINPLAAVVTSSGPFTITNQQIFILDKSVAGATTINLPSVSSRNLAPLSIIDWNGNAGDITVVPNNTDTIMGANTSWVIGSGGVAQSGASLKFIPVPSLNGWVVQ